MTRSEQQQILFALVALYVLSEWNNQPSAFERDFQEGLRRTRARVQRATEALERGGAAVYDTLHSDSAHAQDLPGRQLSRQALLSIATQVGFANPKLAAAIAYAESGGVTNAVVRTQRETSVGLWQINTLVHPYSVAAMKNPRLNAEAAFRICKGGRDWSPWSAYTSGAYRQFRTGVFA